LGGGIGRRYAEMFELEYGRGSVEQYSPRLGACSITSRTSNQETPPVRSAFVSLRGLVLLVVAIAVGAGLGIGGYWVYDTYFPSPDRALEKAQEKFAQAEEVYAQDPVAAESLYADLDAQLDGMSKSSTGTSKALSTQILLLRAKVLWKRGLIAEVRDKGTTGAAERNKLHASARKLYDEVLRNQD